jgi:hypothetical protein
MGIYLKRRLLLLAILAILAILVILLVGYGEEIGRIEFDHIGDGRAAITIDAGKAAEFWTDLDFKKEDAASLAVSIMGDEEVSLAYTLTFYKDGELLQRLTCDPFEVSSFDLSSKIKSVNVSIGTTRTFKYNGKMKCSGSVSYTGELVVEATLAPVDTSDGSRVDMPDSFKLKKADLVFKQD